MPQPALTSSAEPCATYLAWSQPSTFSSPSNSLAHLSRLDVPQITNQVIHKCKDQIMSAGKLWDQDKPSLVANMREAVRLNAVYREQYELAKATLREAKAKPFDFDEQAIFLKFDLFTKRVNKLIDMFTTIHQFSTLEQHTHIEGLEQMIRSLNHIIDDVKRKPYDLLDFARNQFDRDFLEFNVNIHDLEIQLQVWAGWKRMSIARVG